MKRILCYGDSNTWGASAYTATRYETADQWPHALAALLGDDFEVAQEGLCGRIAGDYDTDKPYYNGKLGFEIALRTVLPADYVIIALGINDLKARYGRSANEVVNDLLWYAETARSYSREVGGSTIQPVYLSLPNYVGGDTFHPPQTLRTQINQKLQQGADPCILLDDLPLSEDGLHWSIEAHHIVAERIKDLIDTLEEKR